MKAVSPSTISPVKDACENVAEISESTPVIVRTQDKGKHNVSDYVVHKK